MYTISGFTTRATVDADYLLKHYPNDDISIKALMKKIIKQTTNNSFIKFEIKSLELINAIKEYQGVRVNLMGHIGRTRTPFSVDLGVGDVIVPSPIKRTLPVLLDGFEEPQVLTYSMESTVAEKLDAIISLMKATSRMKDFYDIYYLAITFDFDCLTLQDAIEQTLINRKTPHQEDSIEVIKKLTVDLEINNRWKNFSKKILKYELDFNKVVDIIIAFTSVPFDSIMQNKRLEQTWSHKDGVYVQY